MSAPTEAEVRAWLVYEAQKCEGQSVLYDDEQSSLYAARAGFCRTALALLDELQEARKDRERYAYCRKGQWVRRREVVRIEGWGDDERVIEEEWTFLQVRVPNGVDLSCGPLVDAAIDQARGATPVPPPTPET